MNYVAEKSAPKKLEQINVELCNLLVANRQTRNVPRPDNQRFSLVISLGMGQLNRSRYGTHFRFGGLTHLRSAREDWMSRSACRSSGQQTLQVDGVDKCLFGTANSTLCFAQKLVIQVALRRLLPSFLCQLLWLDLPLGAQSSSRYWVWKLKTEIWANETI